MSAYRFCRSDDVPALVDAYNRCWTPHFAGRPRMREEDFKRLVRELDVWTSSCMLALEGREPVGVLIAAKRDDVNLVHAVAVHPAHLRRGHARHMMTSLAQKLAILGPPRITAEVPAEWTHAVDFIEACGYERQGTWTDFLLHRRPTAPPAADFLGAVSAAELDEAGLLETSAADCWARSPRTLRNRRETLNGLALAGDERIEAWLLAGRDTEDVEEILAFGCLHAERRETLLGLLFAAHGSALEGPVRIPRVAPGELPYAWLEAFGFRPAGRVHAYAVTARPS